MKTLTKLTLKERRFVDAYLGSAAGNGTKAIVASGYSTTKNAKSAGVMATKLLAKDRIRAEIKRRVNRETQASILTAEQRDAILSTIASGNREASNARIRAIAELNKCGGRHSIKHVVDLNFDPMKYLAEKTPE